MLLAADADADADADEGAAGGGAIGATGPKPFIRGVTGRVEGAVDSSRLALLSPVHISGLSVCANDMADLAARYVSMGFGHRTEACACDGSMYR